MKKTLYIGKFNDFFSVNGYGNVNTLCIIIIIILKNHVKMQKIKGGA